MKTRVLYLLIASCSLAVVAWIVHVSTPGRAPASYGDEPAPGATGEVPEKYRDTVHKGLEYLAKNQGDDGHWEGDGGQHPVAMTGLAGLALLMERDSLHNKRSRVGVVAASEAHYTANVRKAVDWLLARSRAERAGLIFAEHPSESSRYMEGHGLATLFLAGVFMDGDVASQKNLNDVLSRAVQYMVSAQTSQGGWYHTSKVEGHDLDALSATVIQLQALQAAENAGIAVPSQTIHDAQTYLKQALGKFEEGTKAGPGRSRPTDTAAVLACCGWGRHSKSDDELCAKWWTYCGSAIPAGRDMKFGRDELAHYYYAQALFDQTNKMRRREGSDGTWSNYRTALFDHLQSNQNKDGSWPTSDGISVGPVYATALWCTVLQLDRNRHPSMQREPEIRK